VTMESPRCNHVQLAGLNHQTQTMVEAEGSKSESHGSTPKERGGRHEAPQVISVVLVAFAL